MKRDLDLIRKIILDVEAMPPGGTAFTLQQRGQTFPSVDSEIDDLVLLEHVRMLIDGGYIRGKYYQTLSDGADAHVDDLTWQGHEFAATVRDDTVWKKTKSILAKVGGTVSMDLISHYAKETARAMIGP
jgi:hypothetical protein